MSENIDMFSLCSQTDDEHECADNNNRNNYLSEREPLDGWCDLGDNSDSDEENKNPAVQTAM